MRSAVHKYSEELFADMVRRLGGMDPRGFENGFLKTILECMGMTDIEITRGTKDGGVDAYCVDTLDCKVRVQAKRWSQKVGSREVREIRGAGMVDAKSMIIALGGFCREATKEADKDFGAGPCALIDGAGIVGILLQAGKLPGFKKTELAIFEPEVESG